MVTILSEKSKPKRSSMSDSTCICLSFTFVLLAILLVNAYEKHGRKHVGSMSKLFDQMTKKEREEMRHEVEEAAEVVQKMHDEVEEIVEKVEEMKKEAGIVETAEEKVLKEEKKEEVVEEMVEANLGLGNWCGDCKWLDMKITCDKRVAWMMKSYGVTEVAAKEANIKQCSNIKRGLRG